MAQRSGYQVQLLSICSALGVAVPAPLRNAPLAASRTEWAQRSKIDELVAALTMQTAIVERSSPRQRPPAGHEVTRQKRVNDVKRWRVSVEVNAFH